MARTVYVPEAGRALSFADGTTDQQIVNYVRARYPRQVAPAPVVPEDEVGAFESGFYSSLGRLEAFGGKTAEAAGLAGLSKYLLEQSRESQQYSEKYKPDVASVQDIGSATDVAKFAGSTIAQSAPETAVGIAGAYTGALAGAAAGTAVFPGPGSIVGGIAGGVIGGAIAALPFFIGGNLQRQAEEQGVQLEDTDLQAATIGAVAQAPLDAAFDVLVARKLPGAGPALKVIKEGFLKEVAKTAGKGVITEGLTEPAQQAIELAQANPNKLLEFGPEVQREIINAAAAGSLAGGVIGGGAGAIGRATSGPQRRAAATEAAADISQQRRESADTIRFAEINTGTQKLASQPQIAGLVLNKKRVQPTPENGLKVSIDRYSLSDLSGNEISDFSDPVNAVDAVNRYQKLVGKKIPVLNRVTGQAVPTDISTAPAALKPLEAPTAPVAEAATPGAGISDLAVTEAASPEIGIPKPVSAPQTGEGLKINKIFKTALGSQYTLYGDGSTTRIKTPHPGHDPADVGAKPKSDKTYFIRYEDMFNLGKLRRDDLPGTPFVGEKEPGVIAIQYLDGPKAGQFEPDTDVRTFDSPAPGLVPLELWTADRRYHFGNEITEVSDPPAIEPESKVEETPEPTTTPGIWANKDYDVPVEILPDPAQTGPDNREYKKVRLSDGTENFVPQDELSATQPIGAAAPDVTPGSARAFFMQAGAPEPVVTAAEQAVARKKIDDKLEQISVGVRSRLNSFGLKDVQTKFIPAFVDGLRARAVFGSQEQVGGKSIITLATDVYDPDLTVEEMTNKVFETLDRQTIQSLISLGLLRESELALLKKAVAETMVQGKKYTYLERAASTYGSIDEKTGKYSDPDMIAEQAVADLFRDWKLKKVGAPKVAGLINRIIEAVRSMFNNMKRQTFEDVFSEIESGAIGARTPAPPPRFATATEPGNIDTPPNPRMSLAPQYPYGQRVPQVNAADNNRVIENIEYAAIVDGVRRTIDFTTFGLIPERHKISREAISDFIRKFGDRIFSLGQLIDDVKKNGGTVNDALDSYQKAQLSISITANNLENRRENLHKPLIEFIQKNNINFGDFEDFIYARHAIERNERIRESTPQRIDPSTNLPIPFDPSFGSGMPDKEARDIIDGVMSGTLRDKFLRAEKLFRDIIDDTNKLRVDAGLTPDFDGMLVEDESGNMVPVKMYKSYAPLRGFADEARVDGEVSEGTIARLGKGFKVRGREDRRAFGRSSRASDIVAHAMIQNSEAVVRAEKNKVGLSFLSLVEANPELMADLGVRILESGRKPMRKFITNKGVIKTMVDPMYKNRDDVLVVKRNGEEIPILIENGGLQKAMIAAAGSDPAELGKFVRFLGSMNRFLARMNTVYNYEFPLVNFPRDLQQALINISQYEIDGIKRKILADAAPAAAGVFRILRDPNTKNAWSDWYRMFREDGGNTSGFFGAFSIEDQIKEIGKMTRDVSGTPSSRAMKAFRSVGKLLEDYNGSFENAIRLSVYKNLIEKNVSRQKAAFIAKNLTVNFDQRGEYGPFMNSLYLFYNASVQGSLALLTAAYRSKKVRKILGGLVVYGMLQDAINSLMSPKGEDGEPLYDKIPDYELETNFVLMDPFGLTKSGYISFPAAYGSNAFLNLGRSIMRNMRGKYTTGQALSSITWTFVDAFNPIGGTESVANFIVPTALDPIISLQSNLNFNGRMIYPEPFPGSVPKANSEVYFASTNPIAVSIAKFMNEATGGSEYVPGYISISPNVMEYIYDYVLGATGATARRTLDTAMNDLPNLLRLDLEEIDINNVPVVRKLYGNVSERISFEDYFQKVNHVLARGAELKSALEEGNPERIKSVREKYKDELSIYPAIKNLSNRRNKLASELRRLRENDKIPEEQKRPRMDAIRKQLEQISGQVDKLYGEKIGKKYPGLFD